MPKLKPAEQIETAAIALCGYASVAVPAKAWRDLKQEIIKALTAAERRGERRGKRGIHA